ncbi:hypothetical protein ACFQWB_13440 [Paenibacillus thermoaerophilus]|uniref:Uncharacterized protein n=1 Tax=Paenibacillus thermoaerophilus TaxID=1215385 RepID=A0ABW2V780_9BACL|nr:hypothetical protein [Paenibacillus thermoaerophilus]TMV16169.1 hypothetical protein FE781_08880 [Paenibacillus thermoaerophilus]
MAFKYKNVLKIAQPVLLMSILLTKLEKNPSGSGPLYDELSSLLGAGNLTNALVNETSKMDRLKELNLGWARINLYPQYYYSNGKPLPVSLDTVMLQLYRRQISPFILFEYYGSYADIGQELGDYDKWHAIGRAYAKRYAPGGDWAREQGIDDWGVRVFSALNEPDVERSIPFEDYRDALAGLADGVHSVDPTLRVIPGGFSSQNSFDDWTLKGYGTAIAPLLNNGQLDGLDLHTYYDIQYAPLNGTYANSAQYTFDRVKQALGLTREISFYSTEFNIKRRSTPSLTMTEELAAKQFLTAIWDQLGVVSASGKRPVTVFAMPWSLFHRSQQDGWYGIGAPSTDPPDRWPARLKVLGLVTAVAKGTYFESMDPRGKGEYVLAGSGKKLWVWQNLKGWSNRTGTRYRVVGIPGIATELSVYRWNGLWRTYPIEGQTEFTVTGLEPEETYMFLAK